MAEPFESKSLSRFRRATDKSFAATLFCPIGTSILVGTFAASICFHHFRYIIQLFLLHFLIDLFVNQNKTNSLRSSGTVFSHYSSGMIFFH